MNREIKFKVWLPYNKTMMRPKDIIEIQESQISNATIGQMKSWVWLQYTSLKDKDGIEIYEGDVVKMYGDTNSGSFKQFTGTVVSGCAYEGMSIQCKNEYMELGLRKYEYQVIGNIYQNHELLTQKTQQQ